MNAFEILRPHGRGGFVIYCDHASNFVPPALNDLGLPPAELRRHIAWDIGAAGVTRELSRILDSPAILSGVSRLVVDCNRHLDAQDLIPEVSDGTRVPGNVSLSEDQRAARIREWFEPYHAAVESVIEGREAWMALSIHSMTESMAGFFRPWQISLSSHTERSFVEPVLEKLRRAGEFTVGDNQPYDLDPTIDYSTPYHAMRRNMRYLQVEFRQDEIADIDGQIRWARRFADAL